LERPPMRRHRVLTVLLITAGGTALIAAPAAGQPEAPPAPPAPTRQPEAPQAPRVERMDRAATPGRDLILVPYVPPASDRAIAGLPEQAPAEVLTWDRAYMLAIVRARAGGAATAEVLDPQALAEQARRHGAADFARFRKEFLAGRAEAGGAFHDPSGAYLAILRRLQVIDDARRHIAELENLSRFVQEIVQGEGAGLSQLDADLLAEAMVQGRGRMSREVAGFRDALDEWRVALGLSPHAAVIPDRQPIAAFRDVFTAVERWSMKPDRNLAELPRIVGRLPALGDVIIGGQPILHAIEQAPNRMEELLTEAARLAIKNRAGTDKPRAPEDGDIALELRVRRRIRQLLDMRRGYEDAKRGCERAVRLRDQAFERLFYPSNREAVSSRTPAIRGLIDDLGRLRDAEDRLAALWTSFRAERLALYRDLGALPYDDWDAFYADLSAGHAAVEAPQAAPAPPTGPPGP
jgi:hypothetical protein